MNKIYEEITAKGLHLPNAILAQWGLEQGTKVEIESHDKTIVIKPRELSARDISSRACTFLLWEVGDATGVKTPVREGDRWKVTVVLPYEKKDIGQLRYTLDGTLLPEESSTPEQMKAKANED